jgi:type IV pilus assembly protein PilB
LVEEYGIEPVIRPAGCDECGQTGYRGRIPLVEVLPVTPRVKEAIFGAASAAELETIARDEGVRSLRDVGIARVQSGETTLQELERVLGDVKKGTEERGSDRVTDSVGFSGPGLASVEPEEEEGPPPILIVDDDGANRTIAKALLESEGHKVVEAQDGVEAVEILDSGTSFSLVVLDLDMPRMGGAEVLESIRANMATVGLPVIVLTGSTDPEAELELMEAGADDYLRKPFDPRRFMIRIKAALRRAGFAPL